MIVVNNKTNEAYYNVSKTEAGRIVGVNRSTIKFWQEKRIADQSFVENYNNFTIYFRTKEMKQRKGSNLQRLQPVNAAKGSKPSK